MRLENIFFCLLLPVHMNEISDPVLNIQLICDCLNANVLPLCFKQLSEVGCINPVNQRIIFDTLQGSRKHVSFLNDVVVTEHLA